MECETIFHTSGYLEDESQLRDDTDFLRAQHDPTYLNLIEHLRRQPNIHHVFEAGAGTGSLVVDLADAGFAASGIDPNPFAVAIARDRGADVSVGHFRRLMVPVDALVAIDVIEHVPDPRAFVAEAVSSLRHGGVLVLRVPEVSRSEWQWLRGADRNRGFNDADPFRDNSVHITHFSPRGIEIMCGAFGLTPTEQIDGGYRAFRKVT